MNSEGRQLSLMFRRGLLYIGGSALALFSLELGVELYRHGWPPLYELSWAGVNNAKLVDTLSPIARAYNNVLAMLVATVGLAIPLTANMHTPKLIELFLQDRINRVVLSFMAIGAANVLFVMYLIGPEFAPTWSYRAAVAGALLGWIVVIPYFFYVVRFLDPSTIVMRLERDTIRAVRRAASTKVLDADAVQEDIQERLFTIGTMVIKSIDRADRSTAREAVWAFKRIVQRYGELKGIMGAAWFKVDRRDFIGMSSHAITMISRKHTWMETTAAQQLLIAYQNAVVKAPDLVSAVANTVRVVGRQAAERGDSHVLSLCMRTFNSFLREAINRGEVRACFDVLYQYRGLAGDVLDRPDHVQQIGVALMTYAELAEQKGLRFVANLIGFDLEHVVELAYENGCDASHALLDALMEFPIVVDDGIELMRIEVKLIAAGYFHEHDRTDDLERLKTKLQRIPSVSLQAASERLAGIDTRAFHELTDRGVNVEWTTRARRKHIQAVVDDLVAVTAE